MATNSRSGNATVPPDTSTLRSQLTEALTEADGTAADRVKHLQWVHQARVSRLSRTAAELKVQYGAKDAGVQQAEAAVAAARLVSARVAMVHRQMTTPEPDVAAGGWALYGQVVDAQKKPVQGLTVFLVDGAKKPQEAYGFAYTDNAGSFLLKFEGSGPAAKTKTADKERLPDLFIEVDDVKGRTLYLSTIPFQPVIGTRTYQAIELAKSGEPIGKPPTGARKTAAPKRKS